jgi:hypothetical protein
VKYSLLVACCCQNWNNFLSYSTHCFSTYKCCMPLVSSWSDSIWCSRTPQHFYTGDVILETSDWSSWARRFKSNPEANGGWRWEASSMRHAHMLSPQAQVTQQHKTHFQEHFLLLAHGVLHSLKVGVQCEVSCWLYNQSPFFQQICKCWKLPTSDQAIHFSSQSLKWIMSCVSDRHRVWTGNWS